MRRTAIFILTLFALLSARAQDRGLNVIAREVTGNPDFDAGRQVAVIIGIDRYKEWPSLRSAVSEAKAVRKVLADRYVIDEFFELYDTDATGVNIRRLFIETLPARIGSKDSLLVFYAGHGQTDATKTGFWIASDGSKDQFSQNNWIPNQQLRNMISGLRAQRILILADACFSGDFLNVTRGATPTIDNAYYKKALQLTARQVLTSGSSESVPDESEFGRQLINILERNEAAIFDPVSMYERLRLGVSKTLPLLGTMLGNEEGASFAFFLKGAGASTGTVTAISTSYAGGKPADLMVKASEAGAEILVDGVSRGKSPLLVSALPSGRNLRIEARTGLTYGVAEVSLNPGELREVSVVMTVRTGNLVITSNEAAVRVIFDGNDKGALGSGIIRDLPMGTHRLELVGQDLYYATTVTVPPEATAQLVAQVQPVGSLAIKIPSDAIVTIASGGLSRTQKGVGVVTNLPAGVYALSVGDGDWLPASTKVTISRGQQVSWEPWKGGAIAFNVNPPNAICILGEGQSLETGHPSLGIAPGTYKAVLRKAGYRDENLSISVDLGKQTQVKASLEMLKPGALLLPPLTVDLGLSVEGSTIKGKNVLGGMQRFEGIPAGYPVEIGLVSESAFSLDVPPIFVTLKEGETTTLDVPTGLISLPWLPTGERIFIGGRDQGAAEGKAWTSWPIPAGTWKVEISTKPPFEAIVQVPTSATIEIPGYREAMLQSLMSSREGVAKTLAGKQGQTTAGWISLAAGLLGVAGAGAIFYLGNQAMADYRVATDTTRSSALRKNVELFQYGLIGSGVFGGLGLGLCPLLLATGPDPKTLKGSIDALDEGIKALSK
ncbi:MAG: caspase family protein [Spirochaetota bacterium]